MEGPKKIIFDDSESFLKYLYSTKSSSVHIPEMDNNLVFASPYNKNELDELDDMEIADLTDVLNDFSDH